MQRLHSSHEGAKEEGETEHFGLNGRINHEIHENHEKEEFF